MDEHQNFMRLALREAEKAFKAGEVPVGAVLVHQGRVIARGYNQVEMLRDATAHAEMLCLTAGSAGLGNWRLLETTLYCTLEPCSMCAGAALLARVSRLIWGAPDLRHGAGGSWVNLFNQTHPTHSIQVCGGVLEPEAADLMRRFFQKRRQVVENE